MPARTTLTSLLPRKVLFVTGTRADFGKIRGLMRVVEASRDCELHVMVTGMHLIERYGKTYLEVLREGYRNCHLIPNHTESQDMAAVFGHSILAISVLVDNIKPNLIVVHGDRVEAMAGASVGALKSIAVCHVEGGERSGTVDELLRHATSKLSHIHLVANEEAKLRLVQMGEASEQVHVIGSPDLDVMSSSELPLLTEARTHYDIPFDEYAIALFHPVTTEHRYFQRYAANFAEALRMSGENYVVIYPNNDTGNEFILESYNALKGAANFRIFPSIRFEYFLVLLKHARFMIGNSSAGIREAPFYGVPSVNVGSRQDQRARLSTIVDVSYEVSSLLDGIARAKEMPRLECEGHFGDGNSVELFRDLLKSGTLWDVEPQKVFRDLHA